MAGTDKDRPRRVRQQVGADELYTTWYVCPKCKGALIISSFSFCPLCGVRLEWPERPEMLPMKKDRIVW